ncbi:MAG: helix-turn-helix domain-containing protein [Terracidiphilus sp.]|jgi:excisionase family DNA binding protein
MPFADKLLAASHTAANTDRLLSAAEAGNLLGLQASTIYDLVQRGQLEHVRLFGKTVRFKESVILKIIEDCAVQATSPATVSGAFERKRHKPNGKATPDPSQRRRGRGPEAVN